MAPNTTETAFHVVLVSPDEVVFPSVQSTDLASSDLSKTTLTNIRQLCGVSPKYKFTADKKSSISDTVSLEYYVSLTSESQAKLPESENVSSNQFAVTSIPIIKIDLIKDKKTERIGAPALDEAHKTIQDALKGVQGLDSQKAEMLSKTIGERLSDQMAFGPEKATADIFSPADLTEDLWQEILCNNQALHGWYYEETVKDQVRVLIFKKSPHRAFEIRRPLPADVEGELAKRYFYGRPGTPQFRIDDDSEVTVQEIGTAFQERLAKEGFTANSIGASATFGQAATISGSFSNENSHANTKQTGQSADALHVSYNFPRVTVTFEPETLQLSDQCKMDAMNISNDEEKKEFFKKYGNVFVTEVSLGGCLQHTKKTTQEEKANIDIVKTRIQAAAGASFTSPKVGASAAYGHVEGSQTTNEQSDLNRSLAMAWKARGGDTTLCSSPPLWASTVKNYKYWRLLNQSLSVKMEEFIKSVDLDAGKNLTIPSPNIDTDPVSQENQREIMRALSNKGHNDALVLKIQKFYNGDFVQCKEDYNIWMKSLGSKGPNAPIENEKWGTLKVKQKFGVGYYMAHKRLLFAIH